jgi:hypothetical protein
MDEIKPPMFGIHKWVDCYVFEVLLLLLLLPPKISYWISRDGAGKRTSPIILVLVGGGCLFHYYADLRSGLSSMCIDVGMRVYDCVCRWFAFHHSCCAWSFALLNSIPRALSRFSWSNESEYHNWLINLSMPHWFKMLHPPPTHLLCSRWLRCTDLCTATWICSFCTVSGSCRRWW